ncbi:MAG: restriction endonuclease subunit S [Flavobacterium sp.]|nr:restriction endonuclease subunit S [Flavobacterium sp.]
MEIREGYKNSDVGIIPIDWECKDLQHYFSFISYGFTNPMPTVLDGVYMITANDINHGRIKYETARRTTEEAYKYLLSDKSRPKKNNILLTKDGSLGRLALVEDEKICINQSVAIIKPNEKVYPLFLKLLLEDSYYQKIMIDNAGGSTIKHIYITIVNKMSVAIPQNISEQIAIAKTLSDTINLINGLEKLVAKKRNIKQGAMQKLLQPKENWVIKKLGDISEIYTGKQNNQDKVENGQYPFFVRSQSIERINTYSFDGEAILIPGEGNIGKIFHYINGKFDYHQRVYKISDFKEGYFGKYIYRYISEYFGNHAMQNSVKATVDSLRLPTFQVFDIPFPPKFEEQVNIATILSDMDVEITALETKLDKYKKLKLGMMQNLLTGKIRLV